MKEWAAARGVDPWPFAYRLVFAALTEGGGYVYANRGDAFRESTQWSQNLAPAVRQVVVEVLSRSLAFDHDKIGANGGSTGFLQQLSKEYVRVALGASWGWGSIAETMDVAAASRMFLNALTVTDNPVYLNEGVNVRLSDPIAADVLRVQQPLASESRSSNYDASQVARARRLVDNWHPNYYADGGN